MIRQLMGWGAIVVIVILAVLASTIIPPGFMRKATWCLIAIVAGIAAINELSYT